MLSRAFWLLVGVSSLVVVGNTRTQAPANPSARTDAQSTTDVPDGLAASDWSSIRAAYEAGRQSAYDVEDGYRARNPGQQWVTHFGGRRS